MFFSKRAFPAFVSHYPVRCYNSIERFGRLQQSFILNLSIPLQNYMLNPKENPTTDEKPLLTDKDISALISEGSQFGFRRLAFRNFNNIYHEKALSIGASEGKAATIANVNFFTRIVIDHFLQVLRLRPGKTSLLHIVVNVPGLLDAPLLADIESLVKDEASINQQDLSGNTPLHTAANAQNHDMIHWLIEQGANPFLLNKNGESVAELFIDAVKRSLDSTRSCEAGIWSDPNTPTQPSSDDVKILELFQELLPKSEAIGEEISEFIAQGNQEQMVVDRQRQSMNG